MAAKRRSGRRGSPSASRPRSLVRNELVYFILIPAAALLLLGLVMVFSAGSVIGMNNSSGGYKYFVQQSMWAGLGLVLMILLAKIDYHKIAKVAWLGVIVALGLLTAVMFIGRAAGGARRWIDIGPVGLQPTELAKFAIVVFSAYALASKGDKVKKLPHLFVPVLAVMLAAAGLIMLQPDLGSTLVLCFAVILLLVVAGARWDHLALVGAAGGAATIYLMISAPYRRARLFAFVNPWKSPRGFGYQVIQSYIALGSGHIKGLGLGMSRQKFLYLPNAHNDFIFAIIGEELGILGTLVVVFLIGLLAIGGFRIAARASDPLGRLLAAGIAGLIVIQALVNMGGVTGLLPITGVPLPLVSFGGTSLCVCLGCIGILLNIAAQSSR